MKQNTTFYLASLAIALGLTSSSVLQKHLGFLGVAAYTTFVFIVLIALFTFQKKITFFIDQHYRLLLTAFIGILILLFFVAYPIESSGKIGIGSDREEGLNLAVTHLLRGEYPYYSKTHLGNPLTPLPGSFIFALPFVLMGNSAYQNIFWILFYTWISLDYLAQKSTQSRSESLLMIGLIFGLSPAVQYEFISGGDLLANTLWMTSLVWLIFKYYSQSNISSWIIISLAVLLGLGLSSRINFFLSIPIIFISLAKIKNFRSASPLILLVLSTSVLLCLPFYLFDPDSFSPLTAISKIGASHSSWIIPASFLFSCLLSVVILLARKFESNFIFIGMGLSQLMPMVLSVINDSVSKGRLDFVLLHDRYGIMFLLPLFLGLWSSLFFDPLIIDPQES